jgi:hypothetical protein
LEKQYAFPLGQRLVLGVQANAACCLEGGVEGILKQLKGKAGVDHSLPTQPSSEIPSTTTGITSGLDSVNISGSEAYSTEEDFDAFAFLNEDEANNGEGSASMAAQTQRSSSSGPKQGFGGFLKKVAASTGAQLERQMQNLAVRMDQGKNPDLVRVAMYDPSSLELLGVTETYQLPSFERRSDMRFEIPLTVPGSRRQQQVLLKLWIQSGAALLQSTKSAKNYLLGSAVVDCMKLMVPGVTTIPLTSALVAGGQLQICAMPDPKFSQVLTRGWSLTDPDMSGYSSTLNHLPLDQSYVFTGKQPNHWLIAQERATESSKSSLVFSE